MLGADAAPVVLPLLQSADREEKVGALNVLGALGSAAGPFAKEVLPLLNDPDASVGKAK